MGLYQYGVGGNEVKVDANESIAEILRIEHCLFRNLRMKLL